MGVNRRTSDTAHRLLRRARAQRWNGIGARGAHLWRAARDAIPTMVSKRDRQPYGTEDPTDEKTLARRRRRTLRRQSRQRFLEVANDFVPYVVTEQNGFLFVVPTDDPTFAKLFVRRKWHKERHVLMRALKHLEAAGIPVPRTTFVDLGANAGTMVFAAFQAGFSSVVAVEPVPSNFRLLKANIALNGLEDAVRAVEVGVSNHAGVATIDLEQGSRQGRVLARPGEVATGPSQEVRLARVDDLAAEGIFDRSKVGLLLMDVEGHECQVLEGASDVLDAGMPLVLELYPRLLRLAGKINDLGALLARHYTHVLDLRNTHDPVFEAVDQIDSLIKRFEDRSTDLLACRLPTRA